MTNRPIASVENNFTKGLVTEFTGLNFPENAATDTDNCTYTLVGDVTRRLGVTYEDNAILTDIDRTNCGISHYKWNNVGGDGLTQIVVEQVGNGLYFYKSSSATIASPLSSQLIFVLDFSIYTALGGSFSNSVECQYADGNGYLFVFHPNCDPFYCSYAAGVISSNRITVQIRDFAGVNEFGVPVNTRPTALTVQHNYNLINQGWISGNPWSTVSASLVTIGLGSKTFTVAAGLTVTLGDQVTIINNHPSTSLPVVAPMMSGNVTAYAGTTMTINVTSGATGWFGIAGNDWLIVPRNTAYIATWNSAIGNYPSNADVWWYFKNASQVFDPATTLTNVSLSSGPALKGHIILDAFNQQRDVLSGLSVTDVTTLVRPRTGTWFQGRLWYTGVDAQQPATGDAQFTTWTENIYFSQTITTVDQLGLCYQVNDPTSETLFDLLPTDGGVITLQGCGSIYKLFPIQNGLIVFTANGIKFITGSQGIGFAANDYTITDISAVKSISSTSFVNVQGLPYFWNEEGIYCVQPTKTGGLEVDPITVGTILSFYEQIPVSSKKYARAAYHPIDYVIQWIYKSEEATDVTSRYEFNKILNFNNYNKAFYPYTLEINSLYPTVNGIIYVDSPGGSDAPSPAIKYSSSIISGSTYNSTFAEEKDELYADWRSAFPDTPLEYNSYFITGFRLHGQGQRRFQIPYIYVFSRADDVTSYKIQGLWDYASSGNSGRWSTAQYTVNDKPNFGMIFRRHRIRGQGLVLQIKILSVGQEPFDILGWSTFETQNMSP